MTTVGGLFAILIVEFSPPINCKKPLLVAADIYRPAAIDQLETVGKQLNLPVYSEGDQVKPQQIVENALKYAKEEHLDFVICHTCYI